MPDNKGTFKMLFQKKYKKSKIEIFEKGKTIFPFYYIDNRYNPHRM